MTELKTEQIQIRDHSGNPLQCNTFYTCDSLCFPQLKNRDKEGRTTAGNLYKITYIDDSLLEGSLIGGCRISLKGKEAAELASKLRPISIRVVKRIADDYHSKAKSLDDALFEILLRINADQ